MKKLIAVIVILSFLNCKTMNLPIPQEGFSQTFYPSDNARFKHVKYDFYKDENGVLYEQKFYPFPGENTIYHTQIYYDSLVHVMVNDSIYLEKELSDVLDIKTYFDFKKEKKELMTFYSKDKNHVYYNTNNGLGVRITVKNADAEKFKLLENPRYGKDGKHIFYGPEILNGLNYAKHKILYYKGEDKSTFEYIKDDQHVFYGSEIIENADAKTFKLVRNKDWQAEDKNYKYACCGQHFSGL